MGSFIEEFLYPYHPTQFKKLVKFANKASFLPQLKNISNITCEYDATVPQPPDERPINQPRPATSAEDLRKHCTTLFYEHLQACLCCSTYPNEETESAKLYLSNARTAFRGMAEVAFFTFDQIELLISYYNVFQTLHVGEKRLCLALFVMKGPQFEVDKPQS